MNEVGEGRSRGARPSPDVPDDVAVGRAAEGAYLYRPGEVLVSERDLDQRGGDLRRRLEGDFGAVVTEAPPSRLRRPERARLAYQRDPNQAAVARACANMHLPEGAGESAQQHFCDQAVAREARLRDRAAASRRDQSAALARLGVALLVVDGSAPPMPRMLDGLRAADDANLRVTPHHVLTGEQDYHWGPGTAVARLDDDQKLPPLPEGGAGSGVRIAILDTGVRARHDWLTKAESRGAIDYEELDEDGDLEFDLEAGHGTFVAGVALQQAPGATVVCRAVLDSRGITDDLSVAAALLTLEGEGIDIVNLSLGGPVDGSNPLPLTRRALALLRHENPFLTVVAAAGNQARSQPFYPAAFPDVIGVGALDADLGRASFSNHGPWVNAWALGVDVVSSYVGTDVMASADTDPGGNDGAVWGGTSFAAPRLAGHIAAAMRPA